ncbi:MAG: inorganic phosphate transporter [Verrucomicrobia bacterium]|nr:inorganic phosphate transporter [Verrucomicrobiota bacterium]
MTIELVVLIVILGLVFDYTNGFHDAANVVSTVIATRVLAPAIAITMASFFNMLGATQVSGVAHTITSGLIDPHAATQLMILAAVAGAIVWNLITWYFALPSSSSYALVGGLIGAAFVKSGSSIVLWDGVIYKVIIPMFLSPIAGFFLGMFVMRMVNKFPGSRKFHHMQIGSAAVVALSHGLNDAQKSMGIITLGLLSAGVIPHPTIPLWVIFSCAIVMGLGTAFGGYRIIHTMGFEITKLEPRQGFAAEVGASVVILIASALGMPVSSTHMIAGSITGVGAAKGRHAVKWVTAHKMVIAWFLTLPGAAGVAALTYKLLLNIFSSTV